MKQREFIERTQAVFEAGYAPTKSVKNKLGAISLITITGPYGAGKDTVRRKLYLPKIVSDTIREPRVDNGQSEVDGIDYFFRGNELARVWKSIKNGKYVQFGMGPSGQSFYGSHIKNYPTSGHAVLDIMSNQIEPMRELGFGQILSFYVVPHSLKAWTERRNKRGQLSPEDTAHRMAEAATSLESALELDGVTFVINEDVRRAVDEIRRTIYGAKVEPGRFEQGREIAAQMLTELKAA